MNACATSRQRPRRYHTSGGPHQRTLVLLARRGYPDYLIAGVLQDLSRGALDTINRMDDPSDIAIDALRVPGAGEPWTAYMVRRQRRNLRIKSRVNRFAPVLYHRAQKVKERQLARGLLHLA